MSAVKEIRPSKARSVAEYISWQIHLCGKSQIAIAQETGFEKPNIITMIKQGKTKLPLDKIGKFAKAIEVDPVHLLKLCMSEYWPDTWVEMQKIVGQPILTLNEMEILETVRQSNVINPKLRTDEDRKALVALIDTLKGDNETR
jgi:hypothetical protein